MSPCFSRTETRPCLRLALALLLLLPPGAVLAISMHWKATPAGANWSNGANGVEGHAPNDGDDRTFPAASTILATNKDLRPLKERFRRPDPV